MSYREFQSKGLVVKLTWHIIKRESLNPKTILIFLIKGYQF